MNCAESQDLLLDLAYGELEPARAAEVEEHVAGCTACRAEKSQLESARRLAAPLRDLEDPPEGFDEPILRAARAEAGMISDGTPGPVVEATASVKPLGLQAARLDPHAKLRGQGARLPWWRRRGAVLGSVAAAAAAVVAVVSFSVSRPQEGRVATEQVAPITVRAPSAPSESFEDKMARKDDRDVSAAPAASNALAGSGAVAAVERKKEQPGQKAASAQTPKAVAKVARNDDESARSKEAAKEMSAKPESRKADVRNASTAPASARAEADRPPNPPAPFPAPDVPSAIVGGAAGASGVPAASRAQSDVAFQRPTRSADGIEEEAGAARRAGNYARAAALYREAAALRKESAPDRAAWDLAHAVECLAAGGDVAEAISVRTELVRSFPDQQGPRAAANSALRSVPLPDDTDAPRK